MNKILPHYEFTGVTLRHHAKCIIHQHKPDEFITKKHPEARDAVASINPEDAEFIMKRVLQYVPRAIIILHDGRQFANFTEESIKEG